MEALVAQAQQTHRLPISEHGSVVPLQAAIHHFHGSGVVNLRQGNIACTSGVIRHFRAHEDKPSHGKLLPYQVVRTYSASLPTVTCLWGMISITADTI